MVVPAGQVAQVRGADRRGWAPSHWLVHVVVQCMPGEVQRPLSPLGVGRAGSPRGVHDRSHETGAKDGGIACGLQVVRGDHALPAVCVSDGEPPVLDPAGTDHGGRILEHGSDAMELSQLRGDTVVWRQASAFVSPRSPRGSWSSWSSWSSWGAGPYPVECGASQVDAHDGPSLEVEMAARQSLAHSVSRTESQRPGAARLPRTHRASASG